MQKTQIVRPKECDFRHWACKMENELLEEYRNLVCEKQDGFRYHDGEKIICQNKEGLLFDSSNFYPPLGIRTRSRNIDKNAYILENSREGTIVSRFMSGGFSWDNLENYKKRLISAGLLSYDDQTKIYKTTDLGVDYLDVYYSLRKLIVGVEDVETNLVMEGISREDIIELNNNRKTWLEISASILKKALKPEIKTHIMYSSSLTHLYVNEYLSSLLNLKLIRQIKIRNKYHYQTTDKGKTFLDGLLYLIILSNSSLRS